MLQENGDLPNIPVDEDSEQKMIQNAFARRSRAIAKYSNVLDITDSTEETPGKPLEWVEITFELSLNLPKLLLMGLAEDVCDKVLLRSVGLLGKCVPMSKTVDGNKEWLVQASGVDFS